MHKRRIRNKAHQKVFILSIFLVISLVLSFISSSALAGASHLRVGIIGDQTGVDSPIEVNLPKAYSILEAGVGVLSKQDVDIVLHVGDLVESKKPEEDYRRDFLQATGIIDKLGKPWYMTPGDHDVNPPEYAPGSRDRSREALFVELYGKRVPQVRRHIYYSFDLGGYHFVALNSQETLHADPRWGDIFLAYISDEQLQWLAADLEQNKSAEAIVVFLHQPLWYNWSAWQRVHKLLRQYPITTVIAGHFHYDQDEGGIDGVRYVIVGATGGSVKPASRDAGNVHHVTIMRLEGRKVDFQLLPVDEPSKPVSFTPRIDMDRVQALHTLLGGFWDFEKQNAVFLEDGKLVSSCETNEPATIRLISIGNPLDVPLRVRIGFISEMIGVSSAKFQKDYCEEIISDWECVVHPGARIKLANLSSVDIKPDAKPLWDARLTLTGPGMPKLGTPLNVDVRLSFQGKQGELFIEGRATTKLKACPEYGCFPK